MDDIMLTTIDTEAMYREMLDESYGPFQIGTLTFYASDVLEACDPIAYRIGLSEYEDIFEEDEEF